MNISINAVSFTMAVSIAIVGLCVHLVARIWSPRRLFFVPLQRELTDADHARVRRVLVVNGVITLLGVAATFALTSELLLVLTTTCLPIVPIGLLFSEVVRVNRAEKRAPTPSRYAVPLAAPPGILTYVSPPLQLAQLAMLVLGSAAFSWLLDRLPEVVALHWNARGEVDGRGSPGSLWIFAGMMLFNIAVGWLVALTVARERWALPPNDREAYAALQRRRRTLIIRLTEALMVGINASMLVMWMGIAYATMPGNERHIATAIVAGIVVMAVGTILPIAMMMRSLVEVQEQIRGIAGTDVLGTRESGWIWGGLAYYAPDDPAVFVPKRVGIGQTINLARPGAWAFVAGIILVPLALSLVFIAVAG